MTHILEDFHDFLSHSPTSWHTTVEMGNRLASLDFIPLTLDEKWELERGEKYFVIDDGALAAFVLPTKKPERMALVAAHTDSPALKLKPQPEMTCENMLQLGVEVYGSPILPTWVNRDLVIAGRVIIEQKKGQIEEHLVYFDDAPMLIPVLAPHLDREAYKKGLELHKQDHLPPVATLIGEDFDQSYLETLLKRHISFHKLLDFDLFLVPLEPPRFVGAEGELLASYRLDNLASAHAVLVALGNIDKPAEKSLSMGLFWDHEEIGSSTPAGAQSPLFNDIYKRLCQFYKIQGEDEVILRKRSHCLSVDMTHALNPNYAKKYDPNHSSLLGEGIVIKYNANMRYATTAKSGANVSTLCDALNLKWQQFTNKADNPAGSTVGPLFSTQMGIDTADIGLAQLSMHAAREIISCQDHIDMCTLLTAFLGGK